MRSILFIAFLFLLPAAASAQDSELIAPPLPPNAMPAVSATDLQVRIGALETQLRNMNGALERTQYQNAQLQQTLQRMNADMDGRFQMLERRVGGTEARLAAPPPPPMQTPAPAALMTPPPPAASAPVPGSTQNESEAPLQASAKENVLGTISSSGKPIEAQALYDQAFQAMRQAHYDEAEAKFKQFLKEHPKHRLTENAKYWLGETYYVRGKYQEAAVTFAEGFQLFPKGAKAPDNLLKLSMSLGSLGKKPDACTTLAELKKRFPDASAVIRNRAEQQRKTMPCT